MPATEVAKAKRIPVSSRGMLSIVPCASEKLTLVRPSIRPMKVPRMPSEVSRLGMSSASWEWPGLSITLSSFI